MGDQDDQDRSEGSSRRRFLTRAARPAWPGRRCRCSERPLPTPRPARLARPDPARRSTPIQHIVVCFQENHSFDHYFGSFSGLPAGSASRRTSPSQTATAAR